MDPQTKPAKPVLIIQAIVFFFFNVRTGVRCSVITYVRSNFKHGKWILLPCALLHRIAAPRFCGFGGKEAFGWDSRDPLASYILTYLPNWQSGRLEAIILP